jgi:hypothetical protein
MSMGKTLNKRNHPSIGQKMRTCCRAAWFVFGLMLTTGAVCAAEAVAQPATAVIWVSPQGADTNPGTSLQPKATLSAALRQAREWRRLKDASIKDGTVILLHGGIYWLQESVFLRPEDAGTAGSPTIIRAVAGEKPVLSGGVPVTGWKKLREKVPGLPQTAGEVWVTDAPRVGGRLLDFRQLWVNGSKAVRARDVDDDHLTRITSWNKKTGELGIPASSLQRFANRMDGMTGATSTSKARSFQQPQHIELVLHQMWAIANLRIRHMEENGSEVLLSFQQPEARIQAEHPWPTPMTADSVRSPFYLTNAIEFLDHAGEWYLDTEMGKVYYRPRKGEALSKVSVVAPFLETVVQAEGNLDANISFIRFEGITFSHTTWMRPSLQGHVALQSGMFMTEAYKLRPAGTPENPNKGLDNQAFLGRCPAAVQLKNVQHTTFRNCRFEHLAASGLDYMEATFGDTIEGCLFTDIGSNGIQCGRFNAPGLEAHMPYHPTDERELCCDLVIANNRLADVTNEDWGCVGIAAGYVKGIRILHNEISEVSYMGISLGWGWQKANNCMRDNLVKANNIHHYARHMYDVAGIYTLSVQPKTQILENAVDSIYHPAYVHDPNHWFYLYTDEGSSFITVKDNWCPAQKFLQNANGPGNVWENNGPTVPDSIRRNAGLEPAFRYLLKEKIQLLK